MHLNFQNIPLYEIFMTCVAISVIYDICQQQQQTSTENNNKSPNMYDIGHVYQDVCYRSCI